MMPPSSTAIAACAFQCINHAASAMKSAPETIATSPMALTPPDVPVGTTRPVVIKRGGDFESIPISVPQVSAAEAASAPAPATSQSDDGNRSWSAAAAAKTAPFAST